MKLKGLFVDKINNKDIRTIIEMLYLMVLVLYLLKATISTTMIDIRWPANYSIILRIVTSAIVLLKVGYSDICKGKEWFLCLAAGVCFCLSWVSTGYAFLIDTPLLIVGAFGIDYKRILKVSFVVGVYVLLLAVMGSLSGAIKDLIYSANGFPEHSFGAVYTTDFAAHLVYLVLIAWVLASPVWYPWLLVFSVGMICFLMQYNISRCSILVLAASVLVMLYTNYIRKYLSKLPTGKIWRVFWSSCLILCPIVMIGLTYFYDENKNWMVALNTLITKRLYLGKAAISEYGIKMFGTAFNMTGNGGNTGYHASYNFVDSSYVMILVRYGWVILVVLCAMGVWTAYKALRAGNGNLYWAVALIAVHSMIEHHLPDLAYNVLLLLAFSHIGNVVHVTNEGRRCQGNIWKQMLCAVVVVVFIIGSSRGIGYIKTLSYILHLERQVRYTWFVAIATVAILAFLVFMALSYKLIDELCEKRRIPVWAIGGFLTLFVLSGAVLGKCEQILGRGQSEYEAMIETDRPYIEALAAQGKKVCVDELPEIYNRIFGNIKFTLLARNGLAIRENITLFIADTEEQWILMQNGYWYGELPGDRAVYTNSQEAKDILEQTGVSMQEYYSKWRYVDLNDMAYSNNLSMTDEGGLLLRGEEHSLIRGPKVSIASGKLRVKYRIRLLENAAGVEQIAIARVTADSGQLVLKEREITLENFNEKGEYVCTLNRSLWNKFNNIEFLLFVADGVTLEIKEIGYGKIE